MKRCQQTTRLVYSTRRRDVKRNARRNTGRVRMIIIDQENNGLTMYEYYTRIACFDGVAVRC